MAVDRRARHKLRSAAFWLRHAHPKPADPETSNLLVNSATTGTGAKCMAVDLRRFLKQSLAGTLRMALTRITALDDDGISIGKSVSATDYADTYDRIDTTV